jgi:hypothetical protein
MHMIFLHIEGSNCPLIFLTQPPNVRLDKLCDIPDKYVCATLGTPHEMIRYLIRDMFGMLLFHTKHYHMVYHRMQQEERRLTPAERQGECAALNYSTEKGNTADITVQVTRNTSYTVHVQVKQAGNDWKVMSFDAL